MRGVELSSAGLMSLLLAAFAVSVGYSIVLPVLPFLMERSSGIHDAALSARHTGMITATYVLAVFLFAPWWGSLADRWGRRSVLIIGLAGFIASAAVFSLWDGLPALYFGRFLGGLFGAAIAPAALALASDHAGSRQQRAVSFALISGAATLGFFVGPLLGAAAGASEELLSGMAVNAFSALSYASALLAFAALAAIWLCLPREGRLPLSSASTTVGAGKDWRSMWRLWAIAFATAAAVGTFEVGISLRGKFVLAMDSLEIGMMFAVCSLVMFLAQGVVLSPWVRPDWTRWLFLPGIASLSLGLMLVPVATSALATFSSVTLVAASAGVLAPLVAYWVSLTAGANIGADLGAVTAAASLGQLVGSMAGGFLFTPSIMPAAGFAVAATVVLSTLFAAWGLPQRLTQRSAAIENVRNSTSLPGWRPKSSW